MEEKKLNETRRDYALIGVLGITVLALLMLVSTAGAEPFEYIPHYSNNNVDVIDTATNTVTSVIPVGNSPYEVAISPDRTKLYVTNQWDSINSVTVIDTSTNKIIDTMNLGRLCQGVAVTPDGKNLYVTNIDGSQDIVYVIDTTTKAVIARISIGNRPAGVAISPDGTKAYVTNFNSNNVSIVDTATNTVTDTVEVGISPSGVAVSPDGTKLYVVNYNGRTVSVVNTTTYTIIATVPVGFAPFDIVLNLDGTKAYVPNYGAKSVSVIDTATNTVTATVPVGNAPWRVSVTSDGTKVYVANGQEIPVSTSVIDTATNTVIAKIHEYATTPTITWNPPAEIIYGTALSGTQLNAVSSVPGTFAYTTEGNPTGLGDILSAGARILKVDFTPTDTANYNSVSQMVTITILKATPTITWDNPADIIAGTALSFTQLNAVASVPGTFVYTPAEGTVLNAGTQTLKVDFTPADATNYTTVSKDVTINVLEKPVVPVAYFSASSTTGKAPLTVTFTDKSAGSPTSWSWNFGDKSTSIDQSPVHTYNKAGKYTVSLTVKNELGSNTRKISNYIVVKR